MSSQYYAAAIQTDMPNPRDRAEMERNTDRICFLIEQAVVGYKPFLPVKLVVFPEFAHAAPVYPEVDELREKLGVPIPNAHTERLWRLARRYQIYIQSGSMLEVDEKYPGALFNTTCLIGPEGLLTKYRKVYPWLPWEVHTSPHDIPGYQEDLFPVAETPIGRIGAAICYDWIFPEVLRELAMKGAEILVRVSAYMDPFGATPPQDWWTVVNRCRALENICYVVAANQAASLEHYPPFSWPGGSMIVDYDGRVVAQATPGSGEKIVVAPIDLSLLRREREMRSAHHMLSQLRSSAHHYLEREVFAGGQFVAGKEWGYQAQVRRVEEAKRKWEEEREAGLGVPKPG